MFASENKFPIILKIGLLILGVLIAIGLVRFLTPQSPPINRDRVSTPISEHSFEPVSYSRPQSETSGEPQARPSENSEFEPKTLTEAEQQEKLFAQIVERFPLSESGKLEPDDATKSFLNMVYNGLKGGSQQSFDSEAMNQLQLQLRQSLPAGAGDEAAQLLWQYFEYRDAERDILVPELDGDRLVGLFEQIRELRRSYLGEEVADSLFGEEEAMASFVIQARVLSKDSELSPQAREEKSRALQQAFTERFSNSIPPQAIDAIQQKAASMREQGVDEAEIFNMQVNAVGRQRAEVMADR